MIWSPERARYIAAFAYILSRVARADMNISEVETREMENQVSRLSQLPAEQAVLVVQIAKTQATLFGGTENFLVTQEFNRMATVEQKLSLLQCLFAVAAADKVISSVEDREIRLINDELQLTHDQYISTRYNFREYLAVLKGSNRVHPRPLAGDADRRRGSSGSNCKQAATPGLVFET